MSRSNLSRSAFFLVSDTDGTLARYDELTALIARKAGGDARAALNTLELAWQTAQAEGTALEERHVEDAARRRPVVYDKGGDAHYDFISAFIKAIRGSDPDAALYYLAAMLEGGEDARYIARRLIVHASEDIGMADPRAVGLATTDAVHMTGPDRTGTGAARAMREGQTFYTPNRGISELREAVATAGR